MAAHARPLDAPDNASLVDTAPRQWVAGLLGRADIRIGGERPWDMRLHDAAALDRALAEGNLGLGEAYMAGAWDCDRLDMLFDRLLRAHLDREVHPARLAWRALQARLFNRQTRRRAWQVGRAHYDLGNAFYAAMLDPRMTYSCGWWQDGASDLAHAQEAKLDLACRKLGLRPGMRLLDIGCGWGSLMGYAAEHYGVRCIGVTVSREQVGYAQARYAGLPLEFRLQDYRELDADALGGPVDRIASIGMFEHVGRRNHRAFMQVARRCLADDGLFLLHSIGKNRRASTLDPWTERHIFPNGDLPSLGQVGDALDGLFVCEDLHDFGADYDPTLMAWHANFEAAWPRFAGELGETFRRKWRYYLLSCAGAFRARELQLWQWVLSKEGVRGGWRRPQ
ncbi:cyclopropane fatty acyl phospholipid synthase [Thermomonas aquatica]|uniref:Cyclopropane fatty acyl phospholipid synthase n=1 Tax=Thermomonas aquatica TaxID=2202149 RepID=A0A5B7ZSD1_9GAMM|nr:cyclopropane fatty acyl phospholipid synthase [Thermomonas aquatica]QDA57433.1 cyclopropane fatty acyl phospholipid synthase [Thermomonas aquatica]